MSDTHGVSGFEKVNAPKPTDNLRGALLMVGSAIGFTLYLLLNKLLSAEVHPMMLAFWRAFFGTLFAIPFFVWIGFGALKTRRPGLLLLRSIFGTIGFTLAILAISELFSLSLAQFSAISFTRPLFVTLLAAIILQEFVGPNRWAALFIGFFGVLVMAVPGIFVFWRPDAFASLGFDYGGLVALGSAFSLAVAIILVKFLTAELHPMTLLIYANAFSTIVLAPFLIFYWSSASLEVWCLILLMSLCGFTSQICFISGMSVGDASFLSPFDYLRLPLTAIADFAVFRLIPGLNVWLGAAIIIGSSFYVGWRERRRKQQRL